MRLWKAKQDSPCNVVEGFLPDLTSQRSLSNICHPYSWFKNHGIIFTLFRFWHLQKRHPYQQRYFFETTESPLHGLGLWTNKQRPLWASLWFLFPPCVCRRISVDERARDRAGPCPWCWTLLTQAINFWDYCLHTHSAIPLSFAFSCLFQSDSVAMDTSQTLTASLKCLSQWLKGEERWEWTVSGSVSSQWEFFPSTALSPKFIRICRS